MAPFSLTMRGPSKSAEGHPITRTNFRRLLAKNPNYFGNFPSAPFDPVEVIGGDVTYEELTCIGFNQNLNLLQGTVAIKFPSWYNGTLCTQGSSEYVRFYIDYGDGAGWQDLEVAGFDSHDIPNANDCLQSPEKPLYYSVTLRFTPNPANQKFCVTPVLPLVRGILSWEVPPPAASPDWTPVWGNVLDQNIQIQPRPLILWDVVHLIPKDDLPKLPPQVADSPDVPIPLPDPAPLGLESLTKAYGKEVSASRFGFPILYQAITSSADQGGLLNYHSVWSSIDLDFGDALKQLQSISGNTNYEQLDCLGLEYNLDRLVATFHVKLSAGYGGGLCQAGSTEYVTFWSDWDDTCNWTLLGTVPTVVHDIPGIPADGLAYAAVLPLDLQSIIQPCDQAKIARVRAVLSWGVPSSANDPNLAPYWGNILDAHVQLRPGVPTVGPQISAIGGIGLSGIGVFSDGLTNSTAKFLLTNQPPDASHRTCPFGGRVVIQGPYQPGQLYRVWIQNASTPKYILTTPPIMVWDSTVNASLPNPADPVTGWRSYLDQNHNLDGILAYFDTAHLTPDATWQLMLEAADASGTSTGSTPWYTIQLDNTAPTCHVSVAKVCGDYTVGDCVKGVFDASDLYFREWSLTVEPHENSISPAGNGSDVVPVNTPWQMPTNGLPACGYVVTVWAWDRSILDSSPGPGNGKTDVQGFCLRAAAGTQNTVEWEVINKG